MLTPDQTRALTALLTRASPAEIAALSGLLPPAPPTPPTPPAQGAAPALAIVDSFIAESNARRERGLSPLLRPVPPKEAA